MMAADVRAVTAENLLSSYGQASLQQMGRWRGLDVSKLTKATLVPQLVARLYDPAMIASALAELEPKQRTALDRLILLGGKTRTLRLQRLLAAAGTVEPRSHDRWGTYHQVRGSATQRNSAKFEDIIARLGVLGLVYSASSNPRAGNVEHTQAGDVLFIPSAVLKHLPAVPLPFRKTSPPTVERPGNSDDFLRDLYALVSVARNKPIPLTKGGLIAKRSLVQIDETLRQSEGASAVRSEADLHRLPFLRALAEDLGLLSTGLEGLRLEDEATAFFSQPASVRRSTAFHGYRDSTRWSELLWLDDVKIRHHSAGTAAGIAQARHRVLAEIATLPPGNWISIEHLSERLQMVADEFLLKAPEGATAYYGSWYGHEPNPYQGHNHLGLVFEDIWTEEDGWKLVEGGFIRAVVSRSLYWLGAVDLGAPDAASPATVFRLNADGAALLRGGIPAAPSPEPNVVIQPNFQILAMPPTGEDVLWTLDRLARRVRAEQVVEYQITRDSVHAAQRDGMDAAAILAFLERVSRTSLPQNVRRSIEEWGAQLERIIVRRGASLIHAVDETTLDTLHSDSELQTLLGKRLAPTATLLPAANLAAVYSRLLDAGTSSHHPLPALSEGNDTWTSMVLTIDSGGRITFRQRLPSIYVRHALSPFTVDDGDGVPVLTPSSLRRAARMQMTAEDIMATLERLLSGPLPDDVVTTVRRWARDWGRGAMEEVTLLRVESAAVMANLLADPEIKPYLTPVPDAPMLATVQRDRAAHIRSLLQDRGMELDDGR